MKQNAKTFDHQRDTSSEFETLLITYCDLNVTQQLRHQFSGLTKRQLEMAKNRFKLQYDELAEVLHVTDRTLHIKKGDEIFSDHVTDKMYAIIDLYSYGYKVFGMEELFNNWMRAKHILLGFRPFELLGSFIGIHAVKDELKRMAYGKI